MDPVRREFARGRHDVLPSSIHGPVRTQTAHEDHAVLTRCSGKHSRTSQLGKLHGQRADAPAGAVNDDVERGNRFARQLQAGMTHVNDSPVNDLPNCPFGGEKNSGLGRYNGQWSIEEFTMVHWISIQHVPIEYPF